MGSYFGKPVDENYKRNQEFMMQLQRLQACVFIKSI